VRLTGIETLRGDGGYRVCSYVKISTIEDGEIVVPTRSGWGSDINEEALKAHPPQPAK
jgi:L-alanine-DL-glutamate epimerase-like enolase superfamily enzyme